MKPVKNKVYFFREFPNIKDPSIVKVRVTNVYKIGDGQVTVEYQETSWFSARIKRSVTLDFWNQNVASEVV